MRRSCKIVVVGSLNIDYIASVQRLPGPGETVLGKSLVQRFGGKGANQAVAAARQGARVSVVGCVGGDDSGSAYLRRLRRERIDVAGVRRVPRLLTGTALIAVDAKAENLIVVAPCANGALGPSMVRALANRIAAADILLLQFEVPLAAVTESIRIANRAGVPVVLNPSPLRPDFPWGKCAIQYLVVNQGEAEELFGLDPEGPVTAWERELQKRQIRQVVITRGAGSTLAIGTQGSQGSESRPPGAPTGFGRAEIPTLKVTPIDTVGAGDAFAGTLAARLGEGAGLEQAIRLANCAGALATLKPGAQEAIPRRVATDRAGRRL